MLVERKRRGEERLGRDSVVMGESLIGVGRDARKKHASGVEGQRFEGRRVGAREFALLIKRKGLRKVAFSPNNQKNRRLRRSA